VLPSLSFDLSSAITVYKKETRALHLQADFRNLNDRVNVLNFASVFSGTAVAMPRSVSVRLRFEY
jgi:hypothetical protein